MRRHEVSDATWVLVAPHLSGKVSDCGVTAKDNRLFFNAVLWIARTGCPWADLPERFGKTNSVCRRFRRLAQKGVWQRLFEAVQAPDLAWVMLDSTVLRAHQHSAGQKKATLKPSVSGAAAGASTLKFTPASRPRDRGFA